LPQGRGRVISATSEKILPLWSNAIASRGELVGE
jgi:hypothetical protein